MTMPFILPDWVPWWLPMVLLVPLALYVLALLVMPFAVLGVKSRLDAIDLRLDEIQGEIRSLALRMREPTAKPRDADAGYVDPPGMRPVRPNDDRPRPPIPPAVPLARSPTARATPTNEPMSGRPISGRAEPKLNWPR